MSSKVTKVTKAKVPVSKAAMKKPKLYPKPPSKPPPRSLLDIPHWVVEPPSPWKHKRVSVPKPPPPIPAKVVPARTGIKPYKHKVVPARSGMKRASNALARAKIGTPDPKPRPALKDLKVLEPVLLPVFEASNAPASPTTPKPKPKLEKPGPIVLPPPKKQGVLKKPKPVLTPKMKPKHVAPPSRQKRDAPTSLGCLKDSQAPCSTPPAAELITELTEVKKENSEDGEVETKNAQDNHDKITVPKKAAKPSTAPFLEKLEGEHTEVAAAYRQDRKVEQGVDDGDQKKIEKRDAAEPNTAKEDMPEKVEQEEMVAKAYWAAFQIPVSSALQLHKAVPPVPKSLNIQLPPPKSTRMEGELCGKWKIDLGFTKNQSGWQPSNLTSLPKPFNIQQCL